MQPGDDQVVDGLGGEAGLLEGVGEDLLGQGDVGGLAEPLLPLVRARLARHPPAVEELLAGRGAGHELGRRPVGHEAEGHGPVPRVSLVGPPGEAGAQLRDDGQGGVLPASQLRGHEGGHARAGRAHQVVGAGAAVQPQGGVDRGGVGLVLVGGLGGGEVELLHRGGPAGGERPTAGLDPEGGGVLVVGGDRPGPPPGRGPQRLADVLALQAPEREVHAPGPDSRCHRLSDLPVQIAVCRRLPAVRRRRGAARPD